MALRARAAYEGATRRWLTPSRDESRARNLAPKIRRRLTSDAAEHPVEMRERGEAGLVGDFRDALLRVREQLLGFGYSHHREVLREGHARRVLEGLAEMERARVNAAGDFREGERIAATLFNDLARTLDHRRFGVSLPRGNLLGCEREMLGEDFEQAQD